MSAVVTLLRNFFRKPDRKLELIPDHFYISHEIPKELLEFEEFFSRPTGSAEDDGNKFCEMIDDGWLIFEAKEFLSDNVLYFKMARVKEESK